jgi:hypothetical protein
MCTETAFTGNKVQVCTVGDLKPGDKYRTPEGRTLMVTNLHILAQADEVDTIDLDNGKITVAKKDTKLGTDRAGRLYASRSLNDPPASAGTQLSTK